MGSSGRPASPFRRSLGHFSSFGKALASHGPSFGVPLGSLWNQFGRFGATWVAWSCRGAPKEAEKQNTRVFVCFCVFTANVSDLMCFCVVSVGSKKSGKSAKWKHTCFHVFSSFRRFRGPSGFEPKHTCFCVFFSALEVGVSRKACVCACF